VNETIADPPLTLGGTQFTCASPEVPVAVIVGAFITLATEGIVIASDFSEVVPVEFAEFKAVIVNSALDPAVKPV